jgi:glycine/D-amino acid oxidase-like deaminating enzyme
VSVGEANQESDYEKMHQSQTKAGYPSDMYTGQDAKKFLKSIWPDFNVDRADVVLHEKPSGYAGTHLAVQGLHNKCMQWGVKCVFGPAVTGYDMQNGRITAVKTTHGDLKADCVVICAGAWASQHWDWLGMAPKIDMRYPDGGVVRDADMWTYWRLLEGEVYLKEGERFRTADDKDPPVLHVELMNTPVITEDGKEFPDKHFYMYVRYAAERVGAPGVQGGTIPIKLGPKATLDPYGHKNDRYQADPWFEDYYMATLAYLFDRFKGYGGQFKKRPNGGIGAFTPDNVPIFDWVKDNAYMIADSNHGYKMIGVGKLVAQHLVSGEPSPDLAPFALTRFAQGRTFGDRNSNCPWV